MKKRFTEEQTIAAVKKLEAGVSAKDLSREMGVTQQTLYHWKKRKRSISPIWRELGLVIG
jgi:transposase-like protein